METIVVEQQDRVGIIYLNRQEFLNAFDDLMGYELRAENRSTNEDG